MPDRAQAAIAELLSRAGIEIGGPRPWDLQVHDDRLYEVVLRHGNLGLGEAYMDGWWDCSALDEFFSRAIGSRIHQAVDHRSMMIPAFMALLHNPQSPSRAWEVGQHHYDLGNAFFVDMLDETMAYSCGYWKDATTLHDAQLAKLDKVCRKLGLEPGMRLLDIGCGWGSLMRFAAQNYGVTCVGLTVSREQAALGTERCAGLPITFLLEDYRAHQGAYDRIASIGMFEHVGSRNYATYFEHAKRLLDPQGLMLLHTIGGLHRGHAVDPWIAKYIFPNGQIPSMGMIADSCDPHFVIEDVENFGADYDLTLMAWHRNFLDHWPAHADAYSPTFKRMWEYYLLSCAGAFRARDLELWQFVLSPAGVPGGYVRPH